LQGILENKREEKGGKKSRGRAKIALFSTGHGDPSLAKMPPLKVETSRGDCPLEGEESGKKENSNQGGLENAG